MITVRWERDRHDRRGRQPSSQAQAEALLASIVQSAHDAIVATSLELEIISWNPGAELLYGYAAEDMIGRPIDVLIPPDRLGDEHEIISLVRAGGRLNRYRTRRIRKDGTPVTISLTVSPLTGPDGEIVGVATMARDIGDRERAEARLRAVLEAAPDAIVAVGDDGRLLLVNGQAERLFGGTAGELAGRPIGALLAGGLPEPGGPQPVIGTVHRRDGTGVPVEITVSSVDTDSGPVCCASIRDITERLAAEAERDRLRAEAERVGIEARLHRAQRLESLGQLAGGVAHDFNNLVGVILNYAEFIAEEAAAPAPDLPAIGGDAAQIVRAAGRGRELTHQLLAFARREVVRAKVLDLNQVVTGVEQLLRRTIGEHITLVTRLAEGLPAISADPGQLEQVLVNLAVNARDAMAGGGQLTVDTGAVEIDEESAAARPTLQPRTYVRLRVSDTGAGMPREVVDRAFEPFFTTKPNGEGTGLGLATVYGIITQAGGDVQLYSEPGMGTTVTMLLPATDAQPASPADPAAEPVHGRGRGETILVAEDEPALRRVITRILIGAGYRVLAADSGVAALRLAAEHGGPVDLLLTDVVMPSMLGKELAERLTADRPDVPVLFMSGYAQPVLAAHGTLAEDVALLEKPFTKPDLLAAVRQRLERA